ncbi:proline-rich receptor-like protein kinase PERK3 [Hibiscus syriacus]|uniref:proline-rich receptor-like protein kinase PERK3 n=1 Tax=Hibiscus syriacus TaxID=106335 RepID=UPI001924F4C4|nr:proline-rich receptor-like protein kinase PERK3 [Hibiscus syriacus]
MNKPDGITLIVKSAPQIRESSVDGVTLEASTASTGDEQHQFCVGIWLCPAEMGNREELYERAIKTKDCRVAQAGSLPRPSSTQFLQYEELKEATNNFAPASTLGEGGFDRVFKCVLTDGMVVAIKRLISGGPQGNKEFLVEVGILSILHHRNLVKLVSYYISRDSSQNLLCYELVPNGSLEAWLQGNLPL